jgi:uncharacterized protein YecE (DUF72 family)
VAYFRSGSLRTFYRTPALTTVKGWNFKTPKGFLFTAKIPQRITHEKVLVDCEAEYFEFLKVMDTLGEKLGPLLFQFGYFNKKVFVGVNDFLARLKPFLKKLPKDHRFAVENRNKTWLLPQFVEALRERGVALALIDQHGCHGPRNNSRNSIRSRQISRMFAGLGIAKESRNRRKSGTRLLLTEVRNWPSGSRF